MARLKNRNTSIPNGFDFVEPSTKWQARNHVVQYWNFNEIVNAVIAHRRGNRFLIEQHKKSVEKSVVEDEVDSYNAQLCIANGWDEYATPDSHGGSTGKTVLPHIWRNPKNVGVVAGAKDIVAQSSVAIKTVFGWLGEGLKPVSQEQAQRRSLKCVNCPLNQRDEGFWANLKAETMERLKRIVEAKNEMSLHVTGEENLHICMACGCINSTKVWVPIDVLLEGLSPEDEAKLHDICWIHGEKKAFHAEKLLEDAAKLTH